MAGWLEARQYQFALVAALLATSLCVFLFLRSPRNSITVLLTCIVASVAEWNLFEWLRSFGPTWPANVQFVGISFLPAFLLHFAVSVVGAGRLRGGVLGAAYFVVAVFAALALGGLSSAPLDDFFWSREWYGYNSIFVAAEGPVLALALVLLAYGAFSGPRELRRVLRYVLVAAVPAGVLGILDLLKGSGVPWAPGMANVGATFASVILTAAAWRHREVFDSVSILQRETAGLLARTRHGLVSFDAAGNAVFANDLAARLLGERPRTLADLEATLPGLLDGGGERYFRRGERVLRATVLPTSSRVGGAPRRYLLVEDCTEEARLLGEMAQRESLASLGEASAAMAHEIRNALTALGTTIDTLSREPRPDPEALRGLNAEVRRLNDSLTRCLSFARELPLERQDVDLHRLLRRVAETVGAGPAVRFEGGGEPAEVYADPDLLGQVIHNLLRNAVDAGARAVRVSARREGAEAVVTVGNDGPPLRPDVLSRLFEPFVTSRPGGTGLGLAICRKIVMAHGGRISGRNVEGGVEFEVRLPWTS